VKPLKSAAPVAVPAEVAAFLLFRERIRVLSTPSPRELIAYYDASPGTPSNRYGRALALTRGGRADEAVDVLAALAKAYPAAIAFQIELARAEVASGRPVEGVRRLKELCAELPGNRQAALAYAEQLTARGERKSARAAVDVLRPLLADGSEDPNLQLTYARASELAGDEIRAGEAHAEVALLNGRLNDALLQLQNLIKRGDVDYYQRARIEARIAEVTPYAIEQRKRELAEQQKLGLGD
jgi:predicted Zn-dependent protease